MASTAESLAFREPSRPSGRPGPAAEGSDPRAVRVPARPESVEAPNLAESSSRAASEPSASPLSVIVDELGQYLVQDVVGGVYGVGRAAEEAFRDYWAALDERLAFLRARSDALSSHLVRQLRALEDLFPGR